MTLVFFLCLLLPSFALSQNLDLQASETSPSGQLDFTLSWSEVTKPSPLLLELQNGHFFEIENHDCPENLEGTGHCTFHVKAPTLDYTNAWTDHLIVVADGLNIFRERFSFLGKYYTVYNYYPHNPKGGTQELLKLEFGYYKPTSKRKQMTDDYEDIKKISKILKIETEHQNIQTQPIQTVKVIFRNTTKENLFNPKGFLIVQPHTLTTKDWQQISHTCHMRVLQPNEECTYYFHFEPSVNGFYETDFYMRYEIFSQEDHFNHSEILTPLTNSGYDKYVYPRDEYRRKTDVKEIDIFVGKVLINVVGHPDCLQNMVEKLKEDNPASYKKRLNDWPENIDRIPINCAEFANTSP